jgi:AcrR family transcriptional regulator
VVSDKPEDQSDGLERRGRTDRPVRADAQRNLETLLQSAVAVFATSGVDAPVREIADQAGVGVGTVYRHFPQRADLIAAVFRREIDACADAAPILAAEYKPFEALANWMQQYSAFEVCRFLDAQRPLQTGLVFRNDPPVRDRRAYDLQS